MILSKGDRVVIKDSETVFKILCDRGFCGDNKSRFLVSANIGGKIGSVDSIEKKYQFDYFFLKIDNDPSTYSIPYEVVDILKTKEL